MFGKQSVGVVAKTVVQCRQLPCGGRVDAQLVKAIGRDTIKNVKRKDINGMSFRFKVAPKGEEYRFNRDPNEPDRRIINRFKYIADIGPCSIPAYPDTDLAVRSYDECRAAWEQDEENADGEGSGEETRNETGEGEGKHLSPAMAKRKMDLEFFDES